MFSKNAAFQWKKLRNVCPLTQSKPGPDPKFVKHFAFRIQSKINKIGHSPDPVQSKSSPMLISGGYLASNQNVFIYTTYIKKVIAKLIYTTYIKKVIANNRSEISLDNGFGFWVCWVNGTGCLLD